MTHEAKLGTRTEVVRRLGTAPSRRAGCSDASNCPDVLELSTGDFAIIGTHVAEGIELPPDAGCSPSESIVVVPRAVLIAAARDLLGGV
jgi:hypothetical protein